VTAPPIIEKYANRRLYNTGTFTFVSLDELATMVKRGKNFLVYDTKTGTDITQSVLAQIAGQSKFPPACRLRSGSSVSLLDLSHEARHGATPVLRSVWTSPRPAAIVYEGHFRIWHITSFRGAAELGRYRGTRRNVASPVTATTDFLAPDILNRCGRAVPPVPSALHSTLATVKGQDAVDVCASRQKANRRSH
jgi:hypothetical protein